MQLGYNDQRNAPYNAGQLLDANPVDILTLLPGGAVAQVTTCQITSPSNSTLYTLTVTVDGQSYDNTYTSDGSATGTEIAANLQDALAADARLGNVLVATDSTDTITLTGRVPGQSFTVSLSPSADGTILNTTSAAEAGSIPFGRGVVQRASFPKQGKLPSTSDDTLKVVHATPGAATNAATYNVTVTYDLGDGQGRRAVSADYTADGSATIKEICDALQAKLDSGFPSNSIAVTDDDEKLIFTSEVPNLDFVVAATSSTTAWTVTVATALVPLRFVGVSVGRHVIEQGSGGSVAYPGGYPMEVLRKGTIAVELDAGITPSIGDPVWCRCSASGAEVLGAFRDAQDAADCFFVPNGQWVQLGDSMVNTVGGVRLAALRLL